MYQIFLAGSELLSVLLPIYDGCISNNHHGTAAYNKSFTDCPNGFIEILRVGQNFQSIHLTWTVVSFPDPNQDSYFGTTLTPPRGGMGSNHIRLTVELWPFAG